ncbi:hypothetical protein KRX57_03375 [Weeksellaceae bacterium TAE3-ERU29]|nr:hypothetical protein [Weeksellaceae bacterium TAE3-ERU29]
MDENNLIEYEQLYQKLENRLEELKKINSLIDEIQKDKASLEKLYYKSDWLYMHENQPDKHYKFLEEDRIHNLLQDLYSQEIILLKKIVANIN